MLPGFSPNGTQQRKVSQAFEFNTSANNGRRDSHSRDPDLFRRNLDIAVLLAKAPASAKSIPLTSAMTIFDFPRTFCLAMNAPNTRDNGHGLLKLVVLLPTIFAISGCGQSEKVEAADRPSRNAPNIRAEDRREMTYYTAKQAFGRLTLDLRARKQSTPKRIWYAIPERSAIYSYGDGERLGGIVGGWVFGYEDHDGKRNEARVNCWGAVIVTPEKTDSSKSYAAPITLTAWVLDNTDAHVVALKRGAIANSGNFGGWLMAVEIKRRGMRPVWCGGAWRLINTGGIMIVDAQSGELYGAAGGGKPEPLDSEAKAIGEEWDGGFQPKSSEALMSRSEHPYWWPRTYQGADRRYIYNRHFLLKKIDEERKKIPREAASWFVTGVANAALGNWGEATEDLSVAVAKEPSNKETRFYRGLILMALRDLDGAAVDFNATGDGKRTTEVTRYIEILRGRMQADGLTAFMYNVETEFGSIPLEFRIGSEFLSNE